MGPRRPPTPTPGRADDIVDKLNPSLPEFLALAATHTVVPVWREMMGDLETPVAAFAKLVGDRPGFLLESVEHGGRWGRLDRKSVV